MTTTAPTLAEYAQCFYPQPGCEQALLRLQDEGGLDVLLLLTACWLSVRGQPVEGTDWSAICAEQRPVHQQVIAPLRVARRAVRERGGHQGLYEQIKACEQEAEWQQLRHLGSFCERMGVVVTQAIGADGLGDDHPHPLTETAQMA